MQKWIKPQKQFPRVVVGGWLLASVPLMHPTAAAEPEQPPVCSAAAVAAGTAPPADICNVTPIGGGHNKVSILLIAETAPIEVAGYTVTTDNYNHHYLTPIVEAHPGDTVEAQITNNLQARPHQGMPPSEHDLNPTNLHYFHGGIVSPANAWPLAAEQGNGDNVYVYLRSAKDPKVKSNIFNLAVPIPGENELDARVLEDEKSGFISHPLGLNWYHSHLHGISSTQVLGGMSGLLSSGEATANVKAACKSDHATPPKCLNDVDEDTKTLKKRTKVYYAILRDIALKAISKRPDEPGSGTAEWDPLTVNFPQDSHCRAFDDKSKTMSDKPEFRLGYCQRDEPGTAWLFTLNGQRYPTIRIKKGENVLVRLGNLSANIGYDLALKEMLGAPPRELTVLSLDGVVPARPITPDGAKTPVAAISYPDILLMPAARASNPRAERSPIDFTSPPAQNPRPVPVMTMQPTESSFPRRSSDSSKPNRISMERAFNDSGRFRVRVATPRSTVSIRSGIDFPRLQVTGKLGRRLAAPQYRMCAIGRRRGALLHHARRR